MTLAHTGSRRLVVGDDGRFLFLFSYSPLVVDAVKLIPGRTWNGDTKTWSAPASSAPQVKAFLGRFDFNLDGAARTLIDAADRKEAFNVFVDEDARTLIFRGGYLDEVVQAIKTIDGRRWNGTTKEWSVPAREADTFRTAVVERFRLAVHPAAQPVLQAWGDEAEELRRLSRAETADIVIEGLGPGLDLLPYQKAGVLYVEAARRRTFIADEPGLGKTLSSLAAAERFGRWPVVVVCPTVVETHWRREVERFFPARTARILRGRKAQHLAGMTVPDYLIVGYPVVADWIGPLLAVRPQALIIDESHYVKGASQRTKAVKAIAHVGTKDRKAATLDGAVPADGMVLCLTGTPILNTTAELVHQLQVLGRLDDFGGYAAFTKRYVKLADMAPAARTPDAIKERRRELNERLRAVCLVRRRKAQVLTELPPKRRSFVWVEPSPAVMVDYRKAEDDLIAYLVEKARKIALALGLDPTHEMVMARMRASGAEALVRINVLRQLAAKSKLGHAAEWARTFAESGEQLGIYAHHREITEGLATTLGAGKIIGGMGPAARQTAIDGFQAGTVRTIVLSISAAGVGITLTAASNALFVEQAWNPGTLTQAEDRHHRIGQAESLTCYYLLAEGTIDVDLMALIERKRSEVDNVTDGADVEDWSEGDDPEALLRQSGSVAAEMIELLTRRALDREAVA